MNKWYCRWQTVKEFWFSLDFSRCFTLWRWCANQIKILNFKEGKQILNKVALLEDFYCEAPAESKKLWLTLSPGGPGGPSLPAVPCNTKQQPLRIYHFMVATHLFCLDRDWSRSSATQNHRGAHHTLGPGLPVGPLAPRPPRGPYRVHTKWHNVKDFNFIFLLFV